MVRFMLLGGRAGLSRCCSNSVRASVRRDAGLMQSGSAVGRMHQNPVASSSSCSKAATRFGNQVSASRASTRAHIEGDGGDGFQRLQHRAKRRLGKEGARPVQLPAGGGSVVRAHDPALGSTSYPLGQCGGDEGGGLEAEQPLRRGRQGTLALEVKPRRVCGCREYQEHELAEVVGRAR